MRDNFSKNVKENLAKRVGYLCSNPECSCLTIGPKKGKNGAVNIGVACHITAASEEGPRYNKNINTIQRKSYENGIWLCQNCSKIIDSDEAKYTTQLLLKWKAIAEDKARNHIGKKTEM